MSKTITGNPLAIEAEPTAPSQGQLQKDYDYHRTEMLADTLLSEGKISGSERALLAQINRQTLSSIVWRCVSRLEPIGVSCHSRTVDEDTLHEVVVKAINQVMGDPESLKRHLKENIAAVVRKSDALSPETIDERLLELQKELLQKANQKDDYDAIAGEILQLREMKKQEARSAASRDEQLLRITDLQRYIDEQPAELAEFDKKLFRRLIKEITVHKHFTVEFKSGASVDIED